MFSNSSRNSSVSLTVGYRNITFQCLGKDHQCYLDDYYDGDISGIGVILSFVLTAALTFGALIYGYCRRILPGVDLHEIDYKLIDMLRRWSARPTISRSTEKQHQLEDAMERFILTLSDQQLVTGLAILIAGFVKCDISTYSQQIVATLAWFSCTTHLATLLVLRRYFRLNPAVRTIRVIGMVLVATLLLPSQILMAISSEDNHMCFYCSLISEYGVPGLNYIVQFITIAVFLIKAYFERVAALYVDPDKLDNDIVLRILGGMPNSFSKASSADGPFLNELAIFLFMGAFGLTELILFWTQGMTEVSFGFGQLVAMLLLALPVLAVIEVAASTGIHRPLNDQPRLLVDASGPSDTPTRSEGSCGSAIELHTIPIPGTISRGSTVDITCAEEGLSRRWSGLTRSDRSVHGTTSTANQILSLSSNVGGQGSGNSTALSAPVGLIEKFKSQVKKHYLQLWFMMVLFRIIVGILLAVFVQHELEVLLGVIMFLLLWLTIQIFVIAHRALTAIWYVRQTREPGQHWRFGKMVYSLDFMVLKIKELHIAS